MQVEVEGGGVLGLDELREKGRDEDLLAFLVSRRATFSYRGAAGAAREAAAATESAASKAAWAKEKERMRRKVEEMDYAKMVGNVERAPKGNQEPLGSVIMQLSVGLNVIAAMGTMFFVGFFAARSVTDNFTMQMVGGIVGFVGMLLVEMVLFIARSFVVENAKPKVPPPPTPRYKTVQ